MDVRQSTIFAAPQKRSTTSNFTSDEERLVYLIKLNEKIAAEEKIFRNQHERDQAALIKNPIPTDKAFAFFGLLLGTFPPAAIFIQLFKENPQIKIVLFFTFVNLICAVAGFFSGKLIGRAIVSVENLSWNKMILLLPLLGIVWGFLTGAAGGLFIFIVGAYFGAFVAASVGAAAIPVFTIFHRLLKRGEVIERNQFVPLSVGISLAIAAFILGW